VFSLTELNYTLNLTKVLSFMEFKPIFLKVKKKYPVINFLSLI
jgi:hypothetical protein